MVGAVRTGASGTPAVAVVRRRPEGSGGVVGAVRAGANGTPVVAVVRRRPEVSGGGCVVVAAVARASGAVAAADGDDDDDDRGATTEDRLPALLRPSASKSGRDTGMTRCPKGVDDATSGSGDVAGVAPAGTVLPAFVRRTVAAARAKPSESGSLMPLPMPPEPRPTVDARPLNKLGAEKGDGTRGRLAEGRSMGRRALRSRAILLGPAACYTSFATSLVATCNVDKPTVTLKIQGTAVMRLSSLSWVKLPTTLCVMLVGLCAFTT